MAAANLVITSADGVSFNAPWYTAENAKASIVIYPAMGVQADFYRPVAQALSEVGYHCLLMDLRGNGHCSIRPKRGVDFGYKELVELDLAAAVSAVKKQHESLPVVLLGNSLGGQMSLLYAATHPADIDAVILIACCSVYYGAYKDKVKTWLGTQFLNTVGQLLGYVPGDKLGFAGVEAKTVVSDWAQQARSGNYVARGTKVDYEAALLNSQTPVLCYSFAGDHLAPQPAVQHLLMKLKSAPLTYKHLSAADVGLEKVGHFSWAKQPQPFVAMIDRWLADIL